MSETAKNYCCGPANAGDMSRWPVENVYWTLKQSQYSILIPIAIQMGLYVLWQIAAIVPGFALYNGTAGFLGAYSHLAWWSAIDFLCICFGLASVWFGLGYSTTTGKAEKNVTSSLMWLSTYAVILALSGAATIAHCVLSIIELSVNDSTLAKNYQWVLIVLITLLIVNLLLHIWLIIRALVYRRNLQNAMARTQDKVNMDVIEPVPDEEQAAGPQPSAPPMQDLNARITTPLLAQLQTNKRILHKLK